MISSSQLPVTFQVSCTNSNVFLGKYVSSYDSSSLRRTPTQKHLLHPSSSSFQRTFALYESERTDEETKNSETNSIQKFFSTLSWNELQKIVLKDSAASVPADEGNNVRTSETTTSNTPDNQRILKKELSDKFTFAQKIESTKAGVVGLLTGGVAVTPFHLLHDVLLPGDTIPNGFAQFEFDTDMGSIMSALFTIVYRYCVREGEEQNEMLPMGVIGAFGIVRTLSRVRVSTMCSAAPLDCGPPIGYFNWDMLGQVILSGLESVALFGSAAYAMEYCFQKQWIKRLV